MAPDKPHPLGLSPEAGEAVAKLLKEQREAAAPKEKKPEDVKTVVARIVEDYSHAPDSPEQEKKERRGFFRRR